MREVVRINLDNEMDLILAHKRTMKLAELCGLSLSSQTSFATAVSEIARCSISHGQSSYLILAINFLRGNRKEIRAVVYDLADLMCLSPEAFTYARRLTGNLNYEKNGDVFEVVISQNIPYPGLISEAKINSFSDFFKYEPPLSPYDEIRKKNIQLIELSEKLGESENNYRRLTDTLPVLIFSINENNEVSFTNKPLKESVGTRFTMFNRIALQQVFHHDDIERIVSGWEASRKNRTAFRGEARVKLRDSYIWHLVSIVPQKNEQEEANGWIGSLVDIHAQKLIEETLKDNEALRQAQKKLEESNAELSQKNNELEQFAYIASHDLQEPLRKIRNFTSLAERYITPEEKERLYFNKINLSAERMSNLIKDILNYSKLSVDKQEFTEINLDDTLQDVLNDLDFAISNREAEVNYSKLPIIKGIPVQINQLFYNLLSNSLKFSGNKPVLHISDKLVQGSDIKGFANPLQDKDYLKLSFADNGIGIDERYSKKIFSIFQRLHGKNEYEGTGIGLALCKKVVENHNGAITFKSEVGKGTTFEVYLPVT